MKHVPYLALAAGIACLGIASFADSTIDPAHPYAYGANVGWLNARGDATYGASIGQYFCSNYLYGANIGWVSLGDGTPTNGHAYGNASAADWGVNHDGQGRLAGYAWGANVGWLVFEQTFGVPRVDLRTGNLSGYIWGPNIGWIGLSNAQAYVRTATLDPGPDTDGDGLPDPWEYDRAGSTGLLQGGAHDQDKDGTPDELEYKADTDPLNRLDYLRITAFAVTGAVNRLTWTSRPTRLYRLEATNALGGAAGAWPDPGLGLMGPPPATAMTQDVAGVATTARFYRVQAIVPPP
jgi:hypothetical protein